MARPNANTRGQVKGPTKPGGHKAEEANPPTKAETPQELSAVDALQMALDLAGMIPGAGAVPDLINAAINLMRGDFAGALFSAGAAIPVVGDIAGAGKIIKNADKYMQALRTIEAKVLPNLPAPIRRKLEAYIAKVRAKMDDLLKAEKSKPPTTAPKKEGGGGGSGDGIKSQGQDKGRCTLTPYRQGCKNGATPHHVVPDHVFKKPPRQGGGYYNGGIAHADGLCICVGGATKSSGEKGGTVKKASFKKRIGAWFGALAEHGKIHALMDAQEAALGAGGDPPGTATLGDLEDAGARSAALVTGCDAEDLKRQLRQHHKDRGLPANTKFRADPFGRKSPAADEQLGTSRRGDRE